MKPYGLTVRWESLKSWPTYEDQNVKFQPAGDGTNREEPLSVTWLLLLEDGTVPLLVFIWEYPNSYPYINYIKIYYN